MNTHKEQMNVVIVGHVDHGKSTLIGRLLADTGSLPKGKLEAVKKNCERTARPFEYAFLLDALQDEQAQGITIDTARCFFKSAKRDYIIIDAPGHIEFLKNMVSGAARAEAAILVIDAKEGIQENSKRHGYMMSFLGIKNITVCVNKMDLVGYHQQTFEAIQKEYTEFLKEINIQPRYFIPISAREGENIVMKSARMPWHEGISVLDAFDAFEKEPPRDRRELRFPVQDIYKFTEEGDERRIFAGRVESGSAKVGDEVIFLPSRKFSRIKSIEGFNTPVLKEAFAGQSAGFCLDTQIYIRPGEIMVKKDERLPNVSTKFKANLFWMGRQSLVKGKTCKLKLAAQQVPVVLFEILSVLDASVLTSIQRKQQIDRHDVAECIFETLKPVAFDEVTRVPESGRFVIVDDYEISGGGIILAPVFEQESTLTKHIKSRDFHWDRSHITPVKRAGKYKHKSALVVLTGQADIGKSEIAKGLEEKLFGLGKFAYFLGISNEILHTGEDLSDKTISRIEHVQQLGEMSHLLTDAGLILITSVSDIDEYELEMLKALNLPNQTLVVHVGGDPVYSRSLADLILQENETPSSAVQKILPVLEQMTAPDPEYAI